MPNHKLAKSVYFEKISSVVEYIVLSQRNLTFSISMITISAPKFSGLNPWRKIRLHFILVVLLFKLVPFLVYVTGPVFLPFLAAPPETTYGITHRTISDFSWTPGTS